MLPVAATEAAVPRAGQLRGGLGDGGVEAGLAAHQKSAESARGSRGGFTGGVGSSSGGRPGSGGGGSRLSSSTRLFVTDVLLGNFSIMYSAIKAARCSLTSAGSGGGGCPGCCSNKTIGNDGQT